MDQETARRYQTLLNMIDTTKPLDDKIRAVYDELLDINPYNDQIWNNYIEAEINLITQDNIDCIPRISKLFYKCLPKVASVQLFSWYLLFVSATAFNDFPDAYAFAASKVGLDMNSVPIHKAMLDHVQRGGKFPSPEAKNRFVRMMQATPMNGLNEIFSHPQFALLLPASQIPRGSPLYEEKKKMQQKLVASFQEEGPAAFENYCRWKDYLAWIRVQNWAAQDRQDFINHAYRTALIPLCYYPFIWIDYAKCMRIEVGVDAAKNVFEEGLELLKKSLLLHFEYASFLESQRMYTEAKDVLKALHDRINKPADKTLCMIQYLKLIERVYGAASMRAEFVSTLANESEFSKYTYHLILAVATMEINVTKDKNAALVIMNLAVHKYGDHPKFIEAIIPLLIQIEAYKELHQTFYSIKDHRDFNTAQKLKLFNQIADVLRFDVDQTEFFDEILQAITELDPKNADKTIVRRKFFLPDETV